jgi:hypothetical protein
MVDSTISYRQLGEQAFEELAIPYTSWTGHTEVKIYGHATYDSGTVDYIPVGTATCDAIYGMGEAKLEHVRLDEDTSEVNSLGVTEVHALVKSRDLVVMSDFVGVKTNDGTYRPIVQPSLRVTALPIRWATTVSPSVASTDTDMHVKFLSPYFNQTSSTTGMITDPTCLLGLDRKTFRVFDIDAADSQLSDALATAHANIPTLSFITSANSVRLAKTTEVIETETSGNVRIYDGVAGSEAEVVHGAGSGTPINITAYNHSTSDIESGVWVMIVEINDYWYIIPLSGGGSSIYWGVTDEAGTKDGPAFTVSIYNQAGDTGTNAEVISKISDISAGADCYFTKPVACTDNHLINGECF